MSTQTLKQYMDDIRRENLVGLACTVSTANPGAADKVREAIALLPTFDRVMGFELPDNQRPFAEARVILEGVLAELDPLRAAEEAEPNYWLDYLRALDRVTVRKMAQRRGMNNVMTRTEDDILGSLLVLGPPAPGEE
jgi:hypothetical protein